MEIASKTFMSFHVFFNTESREVVVWGLRLTKKIGLTLLHSVGMDLSLFVHYCPKIGILFWGLRLSFYIVQIQDWFSALFCYNVGLCGRGCTSFCLITSAFLCNFNPPAEQHGNQDRVSYCFWVKTSKAPTLWAMPVDFIPLWFPI